MAFITPKELETHLYKENIEAISREDETILTAAIDAALQEAYGYLGSGKCRNQTLSLTSPL